MSFLVDTNVVSEWVKPRPNPGITSWLAEADEDRVFLSVVTLTELRYGVERLPGGRRKKQLSAWLENELPMRFENRILTIDAPIADRSGMLVARSEALGRQMEAMDAFLAATAETYQLTLVTRNVRHFNGILTDLLNPWT